MQMAIEELTRLLGTPEQQRLLRLILLQIAMGIVTLVVLPQVHPQV